MYSIKIALYARVSTSEEKQTIRNLGITVAEQCKAQRKVYDCLVIIRAKMELGQVESVMIIAETKKKMLPSSLRVSR